MLHAVVVVLIALASRSGAEPGLFCKSCTGGLHRTDSASSPVELSPFELTDHQRELFLTWSRRYGVRGIPAYRFTRIQALLALSDLPQSIRYALFTRNGQWLPESRVMERIGRLGVEPESLAPLFRHIFASHQDGGYEQLEAALHRVLTLTPTRVVRERQEMETRLEVHTITSLLGSRSSEYEIRTSRGEVIFPEGQRYPLVHRLENGTLIVEIPLVQVHSEPTVPDSAEALPPYGTLEALTGTFTPDGRLLVTQGSHQVRAHARKRGGQVLVRIVPERDGRYYAATHFEVLHHYFPQWGYEVWAELGAAQRAEALKRIKKSPREYLAPAYHRALATRTVGSLACFLEAPSRTRVPAKPSPSELLLKTAGAPGI